LTFEAIVFDVDGTLVDSNDAHAKAFQQAFADHGVRLPFENIRRLIGKGSDKLIPELIGRYDPSVAERKKAIFRQTYLPRLRAFPKVRELLETLRRRGLRLAVASSAAAEELEALLAVANAGACFEVTVDADDAEDSKPDPDIVQAAVRGLGLPAARCAMVGDTPYDAAAARGAGVAFVAVRCGGWSEHDLQPSAAVYQDPADLLGHLEHWVGLSRHAA
jgi:HAD superfamily hydrolase (TIGR01509 family)